MNRVSRLFVVLALLLSFASVQAFAWNSIGHMTVAYAAYQRLTPTEQARALALLKLNPLYPEWVKYLPAAASDADKNLYIFMMAATWPDEIKAMGSGYTGNDNPPHGELATLNVGYSDKGMHKYWHFINTPFKQDGTALPKVAGPTLVDKIGALRLALATDEPDLLKSYDLVWLLHLVGDAHQPLHCADRISKTQPRGDDGGNLVTVDGPEKELHAFWDGAVGEGDTKDFLIAVKVGEALPTADASLVSDAKEADWAAESFALAKSDAYIAPVGPGAGPFNLAGAYTTNTQKIAEARISLAGARLANLLKTALNCGAQACAN
jgi:hypothetical protein